ncbi:hypothetical protein FB451DRAFT_1563991 [Mycena latifolia]|nr:hypothetical protein FB451DRAFT_1563991 [Mycena latifolia]
MGLGVGIDSAASTSSGPASTSARRVPAPVCDDWEDDDDADEEEPYGTMRAYSLLLHTRTRTLTYPWTTGQPMPALIVSDAAPPPVMRVFKRRAAPIPLPPNLRIITSATLIRSLLNFFLFSTLVIQGITVWKVQMRGKRSTRLHAYSGHFDGLRNSLGLRDERSGVIVQMTRFSLRLNADAHWCTPSISMRILAGTTACNTPRSTMRPSPISYSFLSALTPHAAAYLDNFGATFTGRPHHARCSARPAHTSINIIAVKVTQRAWHRTGSDATKISRTTAAPAVCISLTHLLVLAAANATAWPCFLAEHTDHTRRASALQNRAVAPCWFDNVAIFAQRRGRLADADDRRTWVRVAGGRYGFDPVVVLAQPNAS